MRERLRAIVDAFVRPTGGCAVCACACELRAMSVNEINNCQYSVNINYDGAMDRDFQVLLTPTWVATSQLLTLLGEAIYLWRHQIVAGSRSGEYCSSEVSLRVSDI